MTDSPVAARRREIADTRRQSSSPVNTTCISSSVGEQTRGGRGGRGVGSLRSPEGGTWLLKEEKTKSFSMRPSVCSVCPSVRLSVSPSSSSCCPAAGREVAMGNESVQPYRRYVFAELFCLIFFIECKE